MQKVILTGILYMLALSSFSQDSTALQYTETVNSSLKKDPLYLDARDWVDKTFKDSKSVLSISDKESGELAGKGTFIFSIGYMGRQNTMIPVIVEYHFSIKTKDEKYKYEFLDFNIVDFWEHGPLGPLKAQQNGDWFGTKKWSKIAYDEIKAEVDKRMVLVISSLKSAMQKTTDF